MTSRYRRASAPLSTVCSQTGDTIENSLGSADPDTVTMVRIAVWTNRLAAEQLDHGLTPNQVERAEGIMGSSAGDPRRDRGGRVTR